ncbi:MAG: hypothetical protein EPO61_01495 [Nitrospirae bacterium]|nr:MAG: hypothetical protein EPO61_01495 [Nitrospirota bacterium]
MPYDLTNFTLKDMALCSGWVRKAGKTAADMEEVASSIVSYLYNEFVIANSDDKACALVRFFVTCNYGQLSNDRQGFARRLGQNPHLQDVTCLALLATVGEKAEWNSVRHSMGHQAIPLVSKAVVEQAPMIAQLIKQSGLDIATILSPAPDLILEAEQRSYNVFHVPNARGSPYIPAQKEFVIPYGICSCLGFGGLLPSGRLFSVIMFSKVSIPTETANMFRTLSLSVKTAILPFDKDRVFHQDGPSKVTPERTSQ